MIIGKKIISLTSFIFILVTAVYLLMFKEQITFLHIAGTGNYPTINPEIYESGALCAEANNPSACQNQDIISVDLLTKNIVSGQDYLKDCSWAKNTNTCVNKYPAKEYFIQYLSRISAIILISMIIIIYIAKLIF